MYTSERYLLNTKSGKHPPKTVGCGKEAAPMTRGPHYFQYWLRKVTRAPSGVPAFIGTWVRSSLPGQGSGCGTGPVWRDQRGAREPVPNSDVRRAAEGRDCRGDPGPSGAQGGEQQRKQHSWVNAEASLTGPYRMRTALASLEAWETQTGH